MNRREFSIDQEAARKKLREHRLPGPEYAHLELIKVAHLLGAKRLEWTTVGGGVECLWEGVEVLAERELAQLFSAPFSRRDTPRKKALSHLAIGLDALLAGKVQRLVVEVWGAEGAVAIEYSGGSALPVEPRQARTASGGMRVLVERKQGLFEGLISRKKSAGELELVAKKGRHSRVRLVVDGDEVSRGLSEGAGALRLPVGGEGWSGELIPAPGTDRLIVEVVQHGVVMESREEGVSGRGGAAVVHARELKTNFSQTRLVEDEALKGMMEAVREAAAGALAPVIRSLGTGIWSDEQTIAEGVVQALGGLGAAEILDGVVGPLLRDLEAVLASYSPPRIRGLREQLLRLQELERRVEEWRVAEVYRAPVETLVVRREWETPGGWELLVGVNPEAAKTRLVMTREGRSLLQGELSLPGLFLHLEGPLEIRGDFVGPQESRGLDEALIELLRGVEEVVREAAESAPELALELLEAFLSGEARQVLTRGLPWATVPTVSEPLLPMTELAGWLERGVQARFEVLGKLVNVPFYRDVQGEMWSIAELHDWSEEVQIKALAVEDRGGKERGVAEAMPVLCEGPGVGLLGPTLGVLIAPLSEVKRMLENRYRWQQREDAMRMVTIGVGSEIEPVPSPAVPPRTMSSGEAQDPFVSRLAEELRRMESSFLLGEAQLNPGGIELRGRLRAAVIVEGDRLLLDKDHPAFVAAQSHPEDPVALSFALLVIHSHLENALFGGRGDFVWELSGLAGGDLG